MKYETPKKNYKNLSEKNNDKTLDLEERELQLKTKTKTKKTTGPKRKLKIQDYHQNNTRRGCLS